MSGSLPGSGALEQLLVTRIQNTGPLLFCEYVDEALYNPDYGFYGTGGRAGRRGDFITSPEVGPLFGACIARYLDDVWRNLDRPNDFVVVEAGAGPGTLARSILAAEPECLPSLRYTAVEVSGQQRADHPDGVTSSASIPDGVLHVVLANELLDNLAFDVAAFIDDQWCNVLVDVHDGALVETYRPLADVPASLPAAGLPGVRIPLLSRAQGWCRNTLARIEAGRMLLFDYASPTARMAADPEGDWVRTYRGNARGDNPLVAPGSQDITAQIPIEQIALISGDRLTVTTQADFLKANGISELVEEGRALWQERAHLGDLAAMKARSRIGEAESLLEADGLGGFSAFEWRVPR